MNVLVVGAHPDDEILGCGATMANHIRHGDSVRVLLLADGVGSRYRDESPGRERSARSRAGAARRANAILGVESVTLADLPDNRFDGVDLLDVVRIVEDAMQESAPDVVYTHHNGDLNVDHRVAHQAVVTATRPAPGPRLTTLFFEVASSTEWQPPGSAPPFLPNWFVDVSETLALKLEALAAYDEEMRPWPHARSLEALGHLARWRGASVGVDAAEAFVLGRRLVT